jgi:hypothetical protein
MAPAGSALAQEAARPVESELDKKQQEATAFANQAFDAYQAGDFANALQLYLKANSILPAAAVYYNIARIYDTKLGDTALAEDFYRKFINQPGADPQLVLKATARLAALRSETASKGREAAASTPDPQVSAAPEPASPPPDQDLGRGQRFAGYVVGGVGLVGLGLGTIFGLRAQSKKSDADNSCDGAGCTNQQGVDSMDAAHSAATVSTVTFAIGGAAMAGAVLLLLTAPSAPEPAQAAEPGSLHLVPALGPQSAGLTLTGNWY